MRINIKPSNCTFYVNEEKRKVVCILKVDGSKLINYISDIWSKFRFILMADDLWLPQRFIGTATCAPEDEWNEAIGRELAFSRAKEQFYKTFFKTASNWIDKIDSQIGKVVDNLNEFGFKVSENLNNSKERIEKMMK